MNKMLLELRDVTVDYGRTRALSGVSLRVEGNQVVAVIGPNGAGKSTLMRTIAGLVRQTGGSITLEGKPLDRLQPTARLAAGIAHVPEGRMILTSMTIEENLLLGAHLRKDGQIRQDMEQLYARFPNLAERRHMLARVLSGGEQQMLAIGRALMSRPRLLLLDEPSLGLSPLFIQRVIALIADLNKAGLTILLVEQNVRSAFKIAARAVALSLGRIVLSGTPAELSNERLIDSYLGADSSAHPIRIIPQT